MTSRSATSAPDPAASRALADLEPRQVPEFLLSILESSTEYSIVAFDLEQRIVAWNEGARRIYGYAPEEVVGHLDAFALNTPEDVESGMAREVFAVALRDGKWEGELMRLRRNTSRFVAHVTVTLRRDASGAVSGFTMISRDLTDSQRIERELRDSQEYNRGLIESSIDALITTDPVGLITDVNKQMVELTGYSREELIGSAFDGYFTDALRAQDGIRKVLTEGRVTNYELTIRARDGRETMVSYNAITFRGADGKLRGVFAAARDITEQKRLEEELRRAEGYNRGLIESSLDALVTVDPDLIVTDVNEQMVKLIGYTREELLGNRFDEYFTDPIRAGDGVRHALAEGYVTNYELVVRSRTNRETHVSFNASVFRDPDGQVRGVFAAARDITAQKQLEDELRQAQNYTRGLIESSVDPMITVNQQLEITDVNGQMVTLTGTAKDVLIGSRFDRYFTEPERAAAGVRQTLLDQFVTNYELTLRTASGSEVLVSFNASVFMDTQGRVKGIFAVARDVTAQRRLEERLREEQHYNRSLIEASVDALVTVDPLGRITDVNEQTIRLTGLSRKQLLGTPFASFFTDPERASGGVRKTFTEGLVKNYELVLKAATGSEHVVSFNAAVFKDTAGQVAGIFAAARDITDQKRLEQELREQQTYNRGLIESNIDALMTTDPLGIITDVNKQMCAITGRAREDLIGTPFKTYFTDPRRAEEGIRKVLTEGRVTNYELTAVAADGRQTIVSYNATTFTGDNGQLRGVFAAARDITDQKRLEEKLRESQHYNRGLIESSVDAMLTVAPDLTITDVNEQMVRLTGFRREELVGTSFEDYFTDFARASAGVRQTLEEGYVTNYELTLRSRHRREILVSFNASVFKGEDGTVRGIFAVARDITDQKRLEARLRESQHYNRGLIESSVDALVTVDPELHVTDVNEQMVKLTGFSREELVGSSFPEYFTEPQRAAAGVHQTLETGSVTHYELELKARTGKRTIVSFNAGTFRDTQGRVAGILAAARDITSQKRLERELREQQTYNRGLIEASVDALMTVDPGGTITDVNEQTVKLTGYTRKQLIGSLFVDYFTDPAQASAGVQQTFSKDTVTNYELTLRTRAGRKVPVSFNAAVFRDAAGNVGGILAGAREVWQQKAIEQELREQQTYTRGLIESNIDALMTTDPLGIITDVNRQMLVLTGREREDLIGTPFKTYFTDPRRAEEGIRKVLTEGRVTNYELTAVAADGRQTIVSYNATTFTGAQGQLRGVFAAARDITEQKLLEEELLRKNVELEEQNRRVQEANRLKSEFLANMSHELRTPLNGIIGFTELLVDGKAGPLGVTQSEFLADIHTSSKHLLRLINDVLDLAKVESGKLEFLPEPIDTLELAGETRDILRTIAARKRIRVQVSVEDSVRQACLDPAKLKQVLYNYLSNALKFTPEDGEVSVTLGGAPNERLRVEVRDTGIGIRPQDMGRLFVEFQQLDATSAKRYAGTGLGLALTKRIVEAQGGSVGAESTWGEGACFWAELPRVQQAADAAGPGHAEIGPGVRARVLVIEDDRVTRNWLEGELSGAGYDVVTARSAREAKELCDAARFDAITLDLGIADSEPEQMVARMRAGANAGVPIIVVSVSPQPLPASADIQAHLRKPVTGPDLRATVKRAIAERSRGVLLPRAAALPASTGRVHPAGAS